MTYVCVWLAGGCIDFDMLPESWGEGYQMTKLLPNFPFFVTHPSFISIVIGSTFENIVWVLNVEIGCILPFTSMSCVKMSLFLSLEHSHVDPDLRLLL